MSKQTQKTQRELIQGHIGCYYSNWKLNTGFSIPKHTLFAGDITVLDSIVQGQACFTNKIYKKFKKRKSHVQVADRLDEERQSNLKPECAIT